MVSSPCEINSRRHFRAPFEAPVEILLLDLCGISSGMEDGAIAETDEGEGNVEAIARNHADHGFITTLGSVRCD